MESGRIVEEGAPEDLKMQGGVFARMLRQQHLITDATESPLEGG